MRQPLKQVYPYNYADGRYLRVGGVIALCTFLFLAGLEPVGVNEDARFGLVAVSAIYAAVAGCVFILYFGLLRLVPGWDAITDNWTIGRELLLFSGLFIAVGCINYAIRPCIYEVVHTYDGWALLKSISDTFKVGLLVLGVITAINLGHLIRANEAQAQVVRLLLRRRAVEPTDAVTPESEPLLQLGAGQDEVRIPPAEVIYIMASGNYVEVHIEREGTHLREVVRTPMRSVEEQLSAHSSLVRVHRAFIVNSDRVGEVAGNAQGYQLKMTHGDRDIPVSRSYMAAFNAHTADRHGR